MNSLVAFGALALAPLMASASCGSAFCTINTSWDAHGAWLEPGARFDLRYESIRQDQPRTGTRNVGVGEIPHHHDEVLTVNRNLLGTVDYTFNQDWGVNVLVPMVDRHHDHIHNHQGEAIPESWDFTELGDVRVMARRRLSTTENRDAPAIATSGINFGLFCATPGVPVSRLSLSDFFHHVCDREGTALPEAVYHARVVIEVMREAVSPGEIEDVLAQLPAEYRPLFEAGSKGHLLHKD